MLLFTSRSLQLRAQPFQHLIVERIVPEAQRGDPLFAEGNRRFVFALRILLRFRPGDIKLEVVDRSLGIADQRAGDAAAIVVANVRPSGLISTICLDLEPSEGTVTFWAS
jgi:hypothetical protein